MPTVNSEILSNVVEAAIQAKANDRRWENAVNKGALLIEEERCLPTADGALLIFSPSGREYVTTEDDCRTGDTPCPTMARGVPCKHRAAYHLLALIEEAEAAAEAAASSH